MNSPIDELSDVAKVVVRELCKDNPLLYYEIEYDEGYDKGALISFDDKHRFANWWVWDKHGPILHFISLNPLNDNWIEADPVVAKCIKIAETRGYGGVVVTGLFTEITPDVTKLKLSKMPVLLPDADKVILEMMELSYKTVMAWGGNGAYMGRSKEVVAQLLKNNIEKLHVMGWTMHKEPLHMLKAQTKSPLIKYE